MRKGTEKSEEQLTLEVLEESARIIRQDCTGSIALIDGLAQIYRHRIEVGEVPLTVNELLLQLIGSISTLEARLVDLENRNSQ